MCARFDKRLLGWALRLLGVASGIFLLAGSVSAADPMPLRVNVFPGAQNLPLYVGMAQGIFAKHGLAVEPQFTTNSTDQRAGLAAGKFEIAHAAVDNAVAMVELARQDVIIVMGGDSSMNEFFVPQDVAEQTYDLISEPRYGLSSDARFDVEGFKNMLGLRAEIEGQWGGKPPPAERYVDLSYYERALARVGR